MSFQKKSILGSLVITVGLFSYFFVAVFSVLTGDSPGAADALPLVLAGVVVAVVVVEIACHIAIALLDNPDDEDERDRLIEAKATRIAYFVLAGGCMLITGHTMLLTFFGEEARTAVALAPVLQASLIVCAFIFSEVVGFAMQLLYYRRGV